MFHTARRAYRLSDPVNSSECSGVQFLNVSAGSFVNLLTYKVTVGESAHGSSLVTYQYMYLIGRSSIGMSSIPHQNFINIGITWVSPRDLISIGISSVSHRYLIGTR